VKAKPAVGKNLSVENRFLRLDIDTRDVTWALTEKATGVIWNMARSAEQDVTLEDANKVRTNHAFASSQDKEVVPARNGLPGAYIFLRDFGLGIHAFLDGRSLVVEVERLTGSGPAKVRDVLFPRHFLLPKAPDTFSTWTLGQGAIVPATMKARFHHPEGYSEQDMCFHGAITGGCGMVAIAETAFDMYVAMSHLPKEAPATFIHWLPSLGDLRYTRRVRFTFEKGLNFVRQAKAYRQYMKEQGYFVSLKEKARFNPKVALLKGAAWVDTSTAMRRVRNHSYYCNTFADQTTWLTQLKERTGLKHAVVHVDGWGAFGYDSVHPEVLPPNRDAGGPGGLKKFREATREMGWLFGLHDQYIDIYADAPSYHPDRFMVRENGKPNILNVWAGGLCSHMCSSESLKFVKRNFVDGVRDQYMYHNSPSIYNICQPDASYLDCFCRIHECFNPLHPLTRAETAYYQRECLRTVRQCGKKVVQSCEHAKWYSIPDLDFSYALGHQKADVQVEGGGSVTEAIGLPVPLWNLVFHDAIWTPDWSSDYGQMFLYGASPFIHTSKEGPATQEIEWKVKACKFNEFVGFDEMVNFKLSDDGTVGHSEFSSGAGVTLNRKENTYRIDGPRSVATKGFVQIPK
jgi:hypothetical protein